MSVRAPRYSKEEFARLGSAIYERDILPLLDTVENTNKYVAIDIESGKWEIHGEALAACERLEARIPDSQTWLVRVGFSFLHRLGGPRHGLDAA